MPFKRLTPADVTITITPEDEECGPRASYAVPGIIAPDSPEADEFVRAVEEMTDRHGLWGWCSVRVTARIGSVEGHSHLGGCSYADEADFIKGGYFEQMRDEAIEELQSQIDALYPLIVAD